MESPTDQRRTDFSDFDQSLIQKQRRISILSTIVSKITQLRKVYLNSEQHTKWSPIMIEEEHKSQMSESSSQNSAIVSKWSSPLKRFDKSDFRDEDIWSDNGLEEEQVQIDPDSDSHAPSFGRLAMLNQPKAGLVSSPGPKLGKNVRQGFQIFTNVQLGENFESPPLVEK
jgi:hypothetical protein